MFAKGIQEGWSPKAEFFKLYPDSNAVCKRRSVRLSTVHEWWHIEEDGKLLAFSESTAKDAWEWALINKKTQTEAQQQVDNIMKGEGDAN